MQAQKTRRSRIFEERIMTMAARKIEYASADPFEVFEARGWARAWLFGAGEFSLHEAIDSLQEAAVATGLVELIGQDRVQEILANNFARFVDAR
jgi:hypothetical protein